MRKKDFQEAKIEVITFDEQDVVTASTSVDVEWNSCWNDWGFGPIEY